jgi:hypothetical protein
MFLLAVCVSWDRQTGKESQEKSFPKHRLELTEMTQVSLGAEALGSVLGVGSLEGKDSKQGHEMFTSAIYESCTVLTAAATVRIGNSVH